MCACWKEMGSVTCAFYLLERDEFSHGSILETGAFSNVCLLKRGKFSTAHVGKMRVSVMCTCWKEASFTAVSMLELGAV